jgi:hypothetical protein
MGVALSSFISKVSQAYFGGVMVECSAFVDVCFFLDQAYAAAPTAAMQSEIEVVMIALDMNGTTSMRCCGFLGDSIEFLRQKIARRIHRRPLLYFCLFVDDSLLLLLRFSPSSPSIIIPKVFRVPRFLRMGKARTKICLWTDTLGLERKNVSSNIIAEQ